MDPATLINQLFTSSVLDNIVRGCIAYNIGVRLTASGLEIEGFAKSGTAALSYEKTDEGSHTLSARYDKTYQVETFDDVARIAFQWQQDYLDRGYNWHPEWVNYFVVKGWVSRAVKVTYTVA